MRLARVEVAARWVQLCVWWHSWRIDRTRAAVGRHRAGLTKASRRCDELKARLES